jgi:hypothetical protein
MKKIFLLLSILFLLAAPTLAEAKGFSGGITASHSSYQSQTNSNTYHSSGSFSSQSNGNTYHSGYKTPSNVTNQTRQNTGQGVKPTSKTRGILTHAAAFGTGAFVDRAFLLQPLAYALNSLTQKTNH